MKQKRLPLLFLTALIIFGLGYILTNAYGFGFCFSDITTNTYDVSCHQVYERLGDPLFYGGGALSLIFLILLFFPSAFGTWKKFAVWSIPLVALLFAFYPNPGSGDFLSPYPEQVFKWVSVLYALISFAIIALFKLRRH